MANSGSTASSTGSTDYSTWTWQQVKQAIIGSTDLSTGEQNQHQASVSDPQSFNDAGTHFDNTLSTLEVLKEELSNLANSIGGSGGSYTGQGADALNTMLKDMIAGVDAYIQPLEANGYSGPLQDAGTALTTAIQAIESADETAAAGTMIRWNSDPNHIHPPNGQQAPIPPWSGKDGTVLVAVSTYPDIEQDLTKKLVQIITTLANTYTSSTSQMAKPAEQNFFSGNAFSSGSLNSSVKNPTTGSDANVNSATVGDNVVQPNVNTANAVNVPNPSVSQQHNTPMSFVTTSPPNSAPGTSSNDLGMGNHSADDLSYISPNTNNGIMYSPDTGSDASSDGDYFFAVNPSLGSGQLGDSGSGAYDPPTQLAGEYDQSLIPPGTMPPGGVPLGLLGADDRSTASSVTLAAEPNPEFDGPPGLYGLYGDGIEAPEASRLAKKPLFTDVRSATAPPPGFKPPENSLSLAHQQLSRGGSSPLGMDENFVRSSPHGIRDGFAAGPGEYLRGPDGLTAPGQAGFGGYGQYGQSGLTGYDQGHIPFRSEQAGSHADESGLPGGGMGRGGSEDEQSGHGLRWLQEDQQVWDKDE